MQILVLFVPALLVAAAQGATLKLASEVKPCSRSDPNLNECAVKSANIVVPQLAKGNPMYKILPYDPLHVTEIRIDDSGPGRQVAVDLQMSEVDIVGLTQSVVVSMNLDELEAGRVMWTGKVPRLQMTGQYEVKGRILILPISGKGAMNITLENIDFTYAVKAEREQREGMDFLKVTDGKLEFKPSKAHIKLDNLFNGDKLLGDRTNEFLNENWRELVKDIGVPIGEVLTRATTQTLSALTANVPYDEIFPA